MILAQQLVNGLALGSIYALVAIGLSLIWATAKLLDFAFGEVFMLGGILTWTLAVGAGLPLVVSMAVSLVVCAGLGWLVERGLYFRLFDADHVIVLIATIGMSMILKDGATKIWGSETRVFPGEPTLATSIVSPGLCGIPSVERVAGVGSIGRGTC